MTSLDDRELRGDKGQTCERCGEHFKYQYLYDDHYPCRARVLDPTTAAIETQIAERDHLRAENQRLGRALAEAYTDVEVVKAERDHLRAEAGRLDALAVAAERDHFRAEVARLVKIGDDLFDKGYDQAVREIRDHFAKAQPEVAREIEKIWLKRSAS